MERLLPRLHQAPGGRGRLCGLPQHEAVYQAADEQQAQPERRGGAAAGRLTSKVGLCQLAVTDGHARYFQNEEASAARVLQTIQSSLQSPWLCFHIGCRNLDQTSCCRALHMCDACIKVCMASSMGLTSAAQTEATLSSRHSIDRPMPGGSIANCAPATCQGRQLLLLCLLEHCKQCILQAQERQPLAAAEKYHRSHVKVTQRLDLLIVRHRSTDKQND